MKLVMNDTVLDQLLPSMYPLPYRPVLHLQDALSCQKFVDLMRSCLEAVFQIDEKAQEDSDMNREEKKSEGITSVMKEPPEGFSSEEVTAVDKALSMFKKPELDFCWYGEYGSAIIVHRGDLQMPGMRTVSILGLDGYSFFMHHDGNDGYRNEAEAKDYKILVAGTIEKTKLPAFWKRFQQLHIKSQQHNGDRRTAAGGRQGHQFTPTLIHALAIQAIKCRCDDNAKCTCPNVLPKGGFTDNGRHTGGEPRNTSFALVKFLFEWCLVQCGFVDKTLFQKTMLSIHLHILSDRVTRAKEDSQGAVGMKAWKVRADLDVAFRILEVISMEGEALHASGTSIKFAYDKSNELRLRMDKIVKQLAVSEARRFALPDVDKLLQDPSSFRSPRIHLAKDENTVAPIVIDVEGRIKKNIGPCSLVEDVAIFDLTQLLAWLKSPDFEGKHDSITVLLRLRTVENVFWSRALRGFDSDYLDETDLTRLMDVVTEYRTVFHHFEGNLDRGGLLLTELHSRELLLVWIAYCLAFSGVKHSHCDTMSGVGVALRHNDLEHLVLSDKTSWKVVETIAAFLNQNHLSEKSELFSLRSPDQTFCFAEAFARSDSALQRIWEQEKSDAESRMNKHWEEVSRKKDRAEKLRKDISELSRQLANAEADLANERSDYNRRRQYDNYTSNSEVCRCQARVQSLKSTIGSREGTLKTVLKAPSPVCQPLPRGDSRALRWLFFLHMSSSLRVLATLSFTGQQMLVPRPWRAACGGPDGTELVDVLSTIRMTKGECLSSFYNDHQRCEFHMPRDQRLGVRGDVALVSPRPVVEVRPKQIGPTTVDNMYSKEDGVWWPDAVRYGMEWTGGGIAWDKNGSQAFDPFRIPRKQVISYFTEQLEEDNKHLQWTMRLEEGSEFATERGNRALSCQESRPHWLSKAQFLSFCQMRAYPHKQLRNVLVALTERSLPFHHSSVHSLLKQTLFHVGRLDIIQGGAVHLGWKQDLVVGDELFDTARAVLEDFVDEIKDSPSNYLSALIVGDIVGFLSDWNPNLKTISRGLAASAHEWAEDFAQQAESTQEATDAISFRLRQRLFLSVSILCLAQGPMSADDVRLLVECRALARNVCVDEGERSALREELSLLERRCDSTVAKCIDDILQVVTQNLHLLTDTIRSVIAVIPDTFRLRWTRRGPSSSSFTSRTSRGSNGCVYSINVLTGVVLVNGLPPSSLSSDILVHPLYKRTFGERNFEVIVSRDDVFETIRQVGGYIYSFSIEGGDRLCITETSESGEKLELLDGTTEGIEVWAEELPTRLKRMHSHWLSRDNNAIVLRGKAFFERDVSFILRLSSSEDGETSGDCHVVPDHFKRNTWSRTFDSSAVAFPKIVLHDSHLLSVFAKFEDRRFVHFITMDGCGSLKVSLPRHGLTFEYRDREFHCLEISGFVLSKLQQLEGSLFGFEQYLIIRQMSSPSERQASSILVADGKIEREKLGGSTIAKASMACDENVRWHKYDIHSRFGTLSAGTVSSRLYLAALHASTSFLSPDCGVLLTGFERSIQLARESWVGRVLSCDEAACLSRLSTSCKGIFPSACLLCTDIMRSSVSVAFLHLGNDYVPSIRDECEACPNESAKYLSDLECGLLNYRTRLTPNEECRILGQRGRIAKHPSSSTCTTTINSPPVEKEIGSNLEKALFGLWDHFEPSLDRDSNPEFPLLVSPQSSLEEKILEELHDSWIMHREISAQPKHIATSWSSLSMDIASLQGRTCRSRCALQDHIQEAINNENGRAVPSCVDLKRLSRVHSEATARDLLLVVLRQETLSVFNDTISEHDQQKLHDFIIEWLCLCVIEDKLWRLSGLMRDEQGLEKELRVFRNWDPSASPAWLVFEVEHSIQIWPEQAIVANHLIANSGDVIQLNMGMGKTRVIIPLLVLHWAFHTKSSGNSSGIPRINILPQLLSEACDFFHQRLTASIFNVKLFTLPFCRDMEVSSHRITAMRSLLNLCQESSGFLVVAPEHRLSLELKTKELVLRKECSIASELRTLKEFSWIDVLDECDELLHHRFQLIYAFGSVQELPAGPHRWRAAQALLGAIHEDRDVGEWLERKQHFALQSPEVTKEVFRPIQIASQDSMVKVIPGFISVLAEAILSSPPRDLEWLKDHAKREFIFAALVQTDAPNEWIYDLSDDQRSDVLALRGLLAGGILVHCLQKRHRVDFGVVRPGKKRLSVPFRGADTPSLRSEFSHPDCAIVFTILSYYEDGLSEEEVISTFETLFTLGPNVQHQIYSQWFLLSQLHIQEAGSDIAWELNHVKKIDLANRKQLRKLVKFYRQNTRVIDFWLNNHVFPEEMQYYPQRLTATSWNLADNPYHIVGFSGTNDNHRLLPCQVKQYFAGTESSDTVKKSLQCTNGQMLEVLLNKTVTCLPLNGSNTIDSMLARLKDDPELRDIQAIVDAGALLAGLNNDDIARRLIDTFRLQRVWKYKGVVFFDNHSQDGQWMALEPSGRLLPKNQSPVQEAEAFVIFDEPRCRGADLKLSRTAVALLTIGPKMCKDKLMQAAGRMRQLQQGQSLVMAGTEFLFDEIMDAQDAQQVTPRLVLEWTLSNTAKANMDGLVPWAGQGIFFHSSQDAAELSVEDERLSLEEYYGGAFNDVSISASVENARVYHIERIGDASSSIDQERESFMDDIVRKACRYGDNKVRANCGMDEECERELELEREIEEEKELEIPRMVPLQETDWDKSRALRASCASSLSAVVKIISLYDFVVKNLQPAALSRFAWSRDVYGTSNFFNAVSGQSGLPLTSFNNYLRIVDVFLVFPNKDVLLVSDREADELIAILWKQASNTTAEVTLCHLGFLRSALDDSKLGLTSSSMVLGHKWSSGSRMSFRSAGSQLQHPSDYIVATIQLFAGETMYRTHSRQGALKDILRGLEVSRGPPAADPEYIVTARGNSHSIAYSTLERVCRDLVREAEQDEDENASD